MNFSFEFKPLDFEVAKKLFCKYETKTPKETIIIINIVETQNENDTDKTQNNTNNKYYKNKY